MTILNSAKRYGPGLTRVQIVEYGDAFVQSMDILNSKRSWFAEKEKLMGGDICSVYKLRVSLLFPLEKSTLKKKCLTFFGAKECWDSEFQPISGLGKGPNDEISFPLS